MKETFKWAIGALLGAAMLSIIFLMFTEIGAMWRHVAFNSVYPKDREVVWVGNLTEIKRWRGSFYVDVFQGVARFEYQGKMIIISGNWYIEEAK